MQTFLLHENHQITARMLDYKRLGKQRLESTQLMDVLLRKAGLLVDGKSGWDNHVAVGYWYRENDSLNFLPALIQYTDVMIAEWINRGYKNTIDTSKWKQIVAENQDKFQLNPNAGLWNEKIDLIIESHRARVLQKDTNYYMAKFLEFDIPVPENWENMEYNWMRFTDKQVKELKQGKLFIEDFQMYRKELVTNG